MRRDIVKFSSILLPDAPVHATLECGHVVDVKVNKYGKRPQTAECKECDDLKREGEKK